MRYDVVIVGGGAVGCAIAYVLAKYNFRTALLERNADVCMGTSGKNSAVVHAGFNNATGSLMAKLCVEGNKGFADLCQLLKVPYRRSGKLVVAFDNSDLQVIDEILETGKKNGCIGLSKISREQMHAIEPLAGGIGAMYSGNTAVFDPFLYTIHLAEVAVQNGVDFFLENQVTDVYKKGNDFHIRTTKGVYESRVLINAAGLYSDQISAMAGDDQFQIYPCQGQYFILDKKASLLAKTPIYPVPRKGVGGLGVHLTTTIHGNMLIGPSAEYVCSKEQYATTQHVLDQLFSEAKELMPQLDRSMVIHSYTGIRSKLVAKGDNNFGDFIIEESNLVSGLINLIGIESPGLTASMPIARMVESMVKEKIPGTVRNGYNPTYQGKPLFRSLTCEERETAIKNNPAYGEILCRCEQVTRGDLQDALDNPLGVKTIVGLKNRLRVTMGRCQGGYCLSRIASILIQEEGISPEEIVYRVPGDMPFKGRIK